MQVRKECPGIAEGGGWLAQEWQVRRSWSIWGRREGEQMGSLHCHLAGNQPGLTYQTICSSAQHCQGPNRNTQRRSHPQHIKQGSSKAAGPRHLPTTGSPWHQLWAVRGLAGSPAPAKRPLLSPRPHWLAW